MTDTPVIATPLRRLALGPQALFTDGDWVEAPFIRDEGIRLIQTGNIGLGEFKDKGFRFIDEASFAELNCTEVYQGDVLISRLADPVGRACIAPDLGSRMITSVDVAILRPTRGVDRRFLVYYFSSKPWLGLVRSVARGGTRERISRSQLGALPVAIPSHSTQIAIADWLDERASRIDDLTRCKERLLANLSERRRSIAALGVTGSLTASHRGYMANLHWAQGLRWPAVKIKHVAALGTGHTPSRAQTELWEDPAIPWITTGEIQQVRDDRREVITETRERISELGLANSAAELHPAGTVVLCRTASAGYSAIMGSDMATSQDFATWTCSDRLLPRYLLMCLRAMRRDLQERLAFGSTHKTIYMPDIEDLKIPLPSIAEQQEVLGAIDSRTQKLDELSTLLVSQISLLAEHRQALITAAVTGTLSAAI